MGLFGKSIEPEYEWKFYDKTDLKTNWEVPNLIDSLEINFYFLSRPVEKPEQLVPEKYAINNAVHVFLDQKIVEAVLKDVNSKQEIQYTFYKTQMSNFLEDILNNKFDAVIIYGMTDVTGKTIAGHKIIGKEIVEEYSDVIKIHNILRNTRVGAFDRVTAYQKIKDYPLYLNCNKELLNIQPDENGKITIPSGAKFKANPNSTSIPIFYDTIELTDDDGKVHTPIRAYISEYSAMRFSGEKEDLISISLAKIKEKVTSEVIIEPHRNWWIVF